MADVQVIGQLEDVAAGDWDKLAADDGFYQSYDWLRFVESEQEVPARYVLSGKPGAWAGALTLYRESQPFTDRCGSEDFGDLLGMAGKTLVAGASRGYRSTLLLSGPPARRTQTLAVLIEAALAEAAREGRAGIVLPFLTSQALADTASVAQVRAAFHMPEAEITGCAQGFRAYVERAAPGVRRKIRSDQARFADAGWVVGERNLADCWPEAARLLYSLERKYGHAQRPLQQLERSLASQADWLARRSVVFTCEDDRGIAGVAGCYLWRQALFVRFAGFDYDRLRDGREYFNIVIYAPLRYAEQAGIERVHLGSGAWEAKGYRGASLRPLWSAFIPVGARKGDSGLEFVNNASVRQWIAEFKQRSMRIAQEEWHMPETFAARRTA